MQHYLYKVSEHFKDIIKSDPYPKMANITIYVMKYTTYNNKIDTYEN